MTGGAVLGGIDFPIMHEFLAELKLGGLVRVPVQVEDLLGRTDVFLGIPMAIQAETHAQRLRVADFIHLVDFTVALHATNPAVHMHGMVEINVVGRLVYLNPGNRFAGVVAFTDKRQPRIICQNLIMAIHASRSRGYIRVPGLLHGIVAVTAVQSE